MKLHDRVTALEDGTCACLCGEPASEVHHCIHGTHISDQCEECACIELRARLRARLEDLLAEGSCTGPSEWTYAELRGIIDEVFKQ